MKQDILNYLNDSFGLVGQDAEDIFTSYIQTVEENLQKFSDKDFDIVARAAHSIKGCALNCGDIEMSESAKQAEFAAKERDADTVTLVSQKLEALLKSRKIQ